MFTVVQIFLFTSGPIVNTFSELRCFTFMTIKVLERHNKRGLAFELGSKLLAN
jgi:hypothetical protein